MSQYYIGVKQVFAWLEPKDGIEGYHVVYDRGTSQEYHSWSPKDKFESAYLPMGHGSDGSKITQQMVDSVVSFQPVFTHGEKTAVVGATLKTGGFEMIEASSCVDAKNYNAELGGGMARERIKNRVWHLLGFALQWARNGIAVLLVLLFAICSASAQDCPGGRCLLPNRPIVVHATIPQPMPANSEPMTEPVTMLQPVVIQPALVNLRATLNYRPQNVVMAQPQTVGVVKERRWRILRLRR